MANAQNVTQGKAVTRLYSYTGHFQRNNLHFDLLLPRLPLVLLIENPQETWSTSTPRSDAISDQSTPADGSLAAAQPADMDIGNVETQIATMAITPSPNNTLHVKLSGPSQNSELQFMGMPREIRDAIYRLLLIKKDTILVRFKKNTFIGGWDPYSPAWFVDNSYTAKTLMTVSPKHITNILRANKQTKEEGTDILYGENLFESYHVRAFDTMFVKNPRSGIGQVNAGKIKSARFGVPLSTPVCGHKEDIYENERVLDTLCDILCTSLMGLQHLTLKTKTTGDKPTTPAEGDMVTKYQKVKIRALLVSAARATKFHPCLCRAIWRRWSGGYLVKTWRNEDHSEVLVDELVGEFSVDLVAEGSAPALDGRTMTRKDAYAKDFKSKDTIINSQLVRRIAWLDPQGWLDIRRFGLSKDATSSEVDPSQVERWLGAKQHNLAAELDPETVAATEQYLARFERRIQPEGW